MSVRHRRGGLSLRGLLALLDERNPVIRSAPWAGSLSAIDGKTAPAGPADYLNTIVLALLGSPWVG